MRGPNEARLAAVPGRRVLRQALAFMLPELEGMTQPRRPDLCPPPPEGPIHAIQVPGGPFLAVTDLFGAWKTRAQYDLVISLLDPGTEIAWEHPRHHVFFVHDVPVPGGPNPDPGLVEALLGLELDGANMVLIHCHGGYSRSPAIAMLLARQLGAPLPVIEHGINWAEASPNPWLLAFGEARLGLGSPLQELAGRKLASFCRG